MNNKNMDSLMIIILALGILAGGLVLLAQYILWTKIACPIHFMD